jgi:hypothetical protein
MSSFSSRQLRSFPAGPGFRDWLTSSCAVNQKHIKRAGIKSGS